MIAALRSISPIPVRLGILAFRAWPLPVSGSFRIGATRPGSSLARFRGNRRRNLSERIGLRTSPMDWIRQLSDTIDA